MKKQSAAMILFVTFVLSVTGIIIVMGAAWVYSILNIVYEPPKDIPKVVREKREAVEELSNMSVLLLGLDAENKEGSRRADAIIVATYNKDENTIRLLRLPRDIYIKESPDAYGVPYEGKINGIYSHAGAERVRRTVEDYLGIPLSNYIETDFKGLKDIVDGIGGIDITSDITIDDSNNQQVGSDIYIRQGQNHLNGKQALAYSRIRYIDNDIERGKRQEEVLKAIAAKVLSPGEMPNIVKNADVISKHVKTDMRFTSLVSKARLLQHEPSVIKQDFLWHDFDYNGESFVALDEGEREKLAGILQAHLGVSNPLKPLVLTPEPEEKSAEDSPAVQIEVNTGE